MPLVYVLVSRILTVSGRSPAWDSVGLNDGHDGIEKGRNYEKQLVRRFGYIEDMHSPVIFSEHGKETRFALDFRRSRLGHHVGSRESEIRQG